MRQWIASVELRMRPLMRKYPMCKASPSCMSLPRRVLTLAISAGLIEPDKPQLRLETSYTYADSVELSGLETFAFRLDRLVVVVAAHHAKKLLQKRSAEPASVNCSILTS
jgi:hypothetical protein